MKTKWFALLAVAFALAACQQMPAKNYTSREGNFTIGMPATPKEDVQKVESRSGTVTIHQFAVEHDNRAYIVYFADYPTGLVKPGMEQKLLNAARDGAVSNTHGKLLKERHIKLMGKYPGRELTVLTSDGKVIVKDRMYLVGDRMYQVLVSAQKDQISAPEVDKYLDSFQLTGD